MFSAIKEKENLVKYRKAIKKIIKRTHLLIIDRGF